MHQNLEPEFILVGIMLLMILLLFLSMVIAAVVSLIRDDRDNGE